MSPRSDQAQHRSFTAQQRAEILAEYAAAPPRRSLRGTPRNSAEQLENAKLTARVVRVKRNWPGRRWRGKIEGKAHALLETSFESTDTDLESKP